tara:strand:- start:100 stop:339 length:240 start_codon:yes stop_codon:yes gene_type:complete
MELYKPVKSSRKHKKYMVRVANNKIIHFGDNRYNQFKDKIGLYKKLDHNDNKKRDNYYKRFGKTKDKNSAKYWSSKILW